MSIAKKLRKHNTPTKFGKAVYRKLSGKKAKPKTVVVAPKAQQAATPNKSKPVSIAPPAKSSHQGEANQSPNTVHFLDRMSALNGHAHVPHPRVAQRLDGLINHVGRSMAVIVFQADAGNTVQLGMRTADFVQFAALCEAWLETRVHWNGRGFKELHISRKEFARKVERTDKITTTIHFGDVVSLAITVNLFDRETDMTTSADNKNEDLRYIRGALQDKLDVPGLLYIEDLLGSPSAQAIQFPIDVVYTWVNDEDPDWQVMYIDAKAEREAELRAAQQINEDSQDNTAQHDDHPEQAGKDTPDDAAIAREDDAPQDHTDGGDPFDEDDEAPDDLTDTAALSRFKNRQELRYSLRSVEQYMPWVRKIFIFSNCAKPAWLAGSENVVWVRHEEVIPEENLPTFNSHAIESYLHKIPDLSEHFIYFNDDFFVNQPIPMALFFTANGVCQSNLEDYGVVNGPQTDGDADYLNAARNGADLLREKFNMSPTRLHKHAPYAMCKSVMEQMESEFADGFERTRKGKFRSSTDLSTASFLFHHYGYAKHAVAYGGFRAKLVKNTARNLEADFKMMVEGTSVRTFCLNDGNDSHDDAHWNDAICAFLEMRFPLATRAEMGLPQSMDLPENAVPPIGAGSDEIAP